jgi:hypothetical protein
MYNIHYVRIFVLFTTITIGNGCEFGHFHETLPPAKQLVGEWKSHDGEEYIKIHEDFDIVTKNNHREFHCVVTGKGKRIFVEGSPVPPNPPYLEVTGSFILAENAKDSSTFKICWNAPVDHIRAFGLYEYKGILSLYTYVGDPDNPYSFLTLKKQPQ